MTSDLAILTATEAITMIQDREISAYEYLKSCIEQINRLEKNIHAWAYLDLEKALSQAKKIDVKRAKGLLVGALHGLPVGVKDAYNTYDMPTEMGSPLWKDFTPGNDARVVFYLRQADAVFPGKTVTAEFAVHHPGPTVNPYNPDHTPGTSSSGSAAAVATYMVPLALGTQTAGSTLRPASYCGVYGFKPSFGLVPRTGMLKTTDTLDHVGLLARSIDDLKLFFETVRVKGEDYPLVEKYLDDPKRQKKLGAKWRIAFIKGPKWQSAEQYAKQAIEHFAKKADKLIGVEVEEVELPQICSSVHEIHETIYTKALSYYFKDEYKHKDKLSPIFLGMLERGKKVSLSKYQKLLKEQEKIAITVDSFLLTYDIVLTLTTGGEALVGLDSIDRPDTCLIWTFCGVSSMSLPVFTGPLDLPFGAQIVTRRYSDYKLLRFAKYLEEHDLVPKKAKYSGKL